MIDIPLLTADKGIPPYTLGATLLSMEQVSLTLGTTHVLKDVSGTVKNILRPPPITQGQVIGLLGPSGRGKTQLSRILAGLQQPTTGKVLVHSEKGAVPVQQGIMGMVMQNYPLLDHRTVMGNLVLAAKMAKVPSSHIDQKVDEYLHRFGLMDRKDHYPAQLSGGQKQRIAIIQQLLCSDNFIIMDEPFSGLDPKMKAEACKLITEVASLNELMTIIVITHDIYAAVTVSDHLWMLGFDKGTTSGSRIQAQYDLIERGLAWHPEVYKLPAYSECVNEVTAKFYEL